MDTQKVNRLPALSIPKLEDLEHYDIGLWVWSKPDRSASASTEKKYLNQHVFIEHYEGQWAAGAKVNGEYQIVGIWQEDVSGAIGKLIGTHGKYSKNINPEFDGETVTNRIWGYLAGDAIAMDLRERIGLQEYAVAPKRQWEIKKYRPFP
jgi:hypothetical protein